MTTERLQKTAAGILIFLGIGHACLLLILDGARMARWFSSGLWAAVPLTSGPEPSVEALQNALVFWAGVGSFAVPSVLLGLSIWSSARRGHTPQTWLGWGIVVWFGAMTVLLVPSPSLAGVIAGILLLVAARRPMEPASSAIR